MRAASTAAAGRAPRHGLTADGPVPAAPASWDNSAPSGLAGRR